MCVATLVINAPNDKFSYHVKQHGPLRPPPPLPPPHLPDLSSLVVRGQRLSLLNKIRPPLVTKNDRNNLMRRCTDEGIIKFLVKMIDRHNINQLLAAAVDAASGPDEDNCVVISITISLETTGGVLGWV